jgi:DNA-binding transcriptional ArsR family regulator
MPKEKFLLVSLSESKAKELAQAISNETCRKILDYLAEKEATESELAEKLMVPISTIHYNLQQLQKGNLVTVDEFHYSPKGKEVNHYKLANKYIIIAPKSTYGIKEKLKSILPVAIILAAGAGLIQIFSKIANFGAAKTIQNSFLQEAVPNALMATEKAEEEAASLAQESTREITQDAAQTIQSAATNPSILSSITFWFLVGAVVSIAIYLFIDWLRNKE